MGIIRKAISGSMAVATGGLSLGVVQFRSDTERNTRQLVKLRQETARSGAGSGIVVDGSGVEYFEGAAGVSPETFTSPVVSIAPVLGTDALEVAKDLGVTLPTDIRAGWKTDPESEGQERFWNGKSWTSKTRKN